MWTASLNPDGIYDTDLISLFCWEISIAHMTHLCHRTVSVGRCAAVSEGSTAETCTLHHTSITVLSFNKMPFFHFQSLFLSSFSELSCVCFFFSFSRYSYLCIPLEPEIFTFLNTSIQQLPDRLQMDWNEALSRCSNEILHHMRSGIKQPTGRR